MKYKPTIGLEIHIELFTRSKMFCSCPNEADEIHPNINICSICTGQPGVLPTVNKQAVIYTLMLAKALNAKINLKSYFARKNYFYPDLPKNYQISQYDLPLSVDGKLDIIVENKKKEIRIRRIHLEEDTGKLVHYENYSLIDFNRAGRPLLELVTEPDINSSYEAKIFVEELILLLKYLGISEANPEKGQIRFEANVSLSENGKLGTKVEIKNLSSIRSLKDAIDYEIKRQQELLEENKKIIQETRGFDEKRRITFSQRYKETSEDYRYFPEPDLPFLELNPEDIDSIILPELPQNIRERFINEYNLTFEEVNILIDDKNIVSFFEKTISELRALEHNFDNVKFVFNLLTNDIFGLLKKYNKEIVDIDFTPHAFAHLIYEYVLGNINIKNVKDILEEAIDKNVSIESLMKEKRKITDLNFIEEIIVKIINENKKAVEDYKKGKETAIQFLIGQIMRETKGQIDINLAKSVLLEKLKND
jgi:aspartyl-tRNA(Asn)/glutamyl-tRNA(Gln) amidotransferase subunit B